MEDNKLPAEDRSPDREILTGDHGLITAPKRGANEIIGDAAIKIAPFTWVEVTAKAAAGSTFGDIPVGGIYMTPAEIAPPVGDKWYVLTENIIGFARNWSMEFTRSAIDTTVLKDLQGTSIYGRPTAGGTIGGFLVTNDSDIDEAIRRFMVTYKISSAGVVSAIEQSTEPLTFIGYTLKKEANKPFIEAYYLPKMDLGTLNVGSEVGGLSDFNTPLTLRSGAISRYLITLP